MYSTHHFWLVSWWGCQSYKTFCPWDTFGFSHFPSSAFSSFKTLCLPLPKAHGLSTAKFLSQLSPLPWTHYHQLTISRYTHSDVIGALLHVRVMDESLQSPLKSHCALVHTFLSMSRLSFTLLCFANVYYLSLGLAIDSSVKHSLILPGWVLCSRLSLPIGTCSCLMIALSTSWYRNQVRCPTSPPDN